MEEEGRLLMSTECQSAIPTCAIFSNCNICLIVWAHLTENFLCGLSTFLKQNTRKRGSYSVTPWCLKILQDVNIHLLAPLSL